MAGRKRVLTNPAGAAIENKNSGVVDPPMSRARPNGSGEEEGCRKNILVN